MAKSTPISPMRERKDWSPSSVKEEWHLHSTPSHERRAGDVESAIQGQQKDSSNRRKSSSSQRATTVASSDISSPRLSPKLKGRTNSKQNKPRALSSNTPDVKPDTPDLWTAWETIFFALRNLPVGNWTNPVLKDQGGMSYSPKMYNFLQAVRTAGTSSAAKLSLSFIGLIGTPLAFYNCIPASSPSGLLQAISTFWDGCLFLSSTIVFIACLLVSFFYASTEEQGARKRSVGTRKPRATRNLSFRSRTLHFVFHCKSIRFHRLAFCVMYFFVALIGLVGPWTLILPSWLWHPFLWGSYEVYWPSKLAPATQGLCVDYSLDEGKHGRLPLCLTNENWDTLSTGALSSRSTSDVEAVLEGIAYAKQQSGGIVISILARDVVEFVAPLRQNVESLVPFFSNVAVVVFENDSADGSREAFKRWGSVVKGYEVDLIECDDAVDCKFGKIHRDDVGDFSHSSAVGDMHKYRQRVVDYVMGNSVYRDYSHMLVLDIDLGVSLSPLGVLHSLGTLPNNPVASAGRQPWPTAFGSLVTPYDFSAFRPYATRKNSRMMEIHQAFCGLMPEGDRWRNECDAFSPIQMIQVLLHDRAKSTFVRVESAFNGAVMYPLQLIRDSAAKYDAGEDGQRCEHVGFHMSLKKPMYMNRKWDMHISPTIPGGPNGHRAQRTASRIFFSPYLSGVLQVIHFGSTAIFVWSSMALGAFFLYPLLFQGGLQLSWQRSVMALTARTKKKRLSAGVKTV